MFCILNLPGINNMVVTPKLGEAWDRSFCAEMVNRTNTQARTLEEYYCAVCLFFQTNHVFGVTQVCHLNNFLIFQCFFLFNSNRCLIDRSSIKSKSNSFNWKAAFSHTNRLKLMFNKVFHFTFRKLVSFFEIDTPIYTVSVIIFGCFIGRFQIRNDFLII